MRGTVHLVATDDYAWMRPLFAGQVASGSRRRLAQLGLEAGEQERALAVIGRELGSEGALTRSTLVERLAAAGIEVDSERRVHLMRVVVAGGLACIGPDRGADGTLVLAEEWLGSRQRPDDRDAALGELARRYLGAFAPAGERDFAKWAGLPLRDSRTGLERIATEIDRLPGDLLALRGRRPRAPRAPLVRLLPSFDTYLMGYESRRPAVDAAGEKRVLPGGGVLRPTLCVDGRLVGLWQSKRIGARLEVTIAPFAEPAADWIAAIEAEVADLGRFEDLSAALRAP